MTEDKQNHRAAPASPPPQPAQAAIHTPKLTRVVGLLRGLTGLAGLVSFAVLAGEAVLPEPYRPSDLIGGFHGRLEAADAKAKIEAIAELTRRQAEASAQPPAFAAMETEAFRQQQLLLAESMQVQNAIVNLTDGGCAVGQVIPRGDRDLGWLGDLLRSGCGVGNQVRQDMLNTLRRGGQDNSVLIPRPSVGAAPR